MASATRTTPASRVRSIEHQASTPEAFKAVVTVSWWTAESGVKGSRMPPSMRPIRAIAHLSGIGLASMYSLP